MACEIKDTALQNAADYDKNTPAADFFLKYAATQSDLLKKIPVVGQLAEGVNALTKAVVGIFGGNWKHSSEVRRLLKEYHKWVLGEDVMLRKVDESKVQDMHRWFFGVLGVPVYDIRRLGSLMGFHSDNWSDLGYTDAQKLAAYMKHEEVITSGVTPDRVLAAIQIAKKLIPPFRNNVLGGWKNMPVAEYWYENDPVLLEASATMDEFLKEALTCEKPDVNPGLEAQEKPGFLSGIWSMLSKFWYIPLALIAVVIIFSPSRRK